MGLNCKPLYRVFKPFVEEYKLHYLFVLRVRSVPFSMSHISLHQPVINYVLCVNPVRIPTATFLFQKTNICYTDASI